MKENIQKCIEYLNQLSLKEPKNIRVEEVSADGITLSFEENTGYDWHNERLFRTFQLKSTEGITWVYSMKTKN